VCEDPCTEPPKKDWYSGHSVFCGVTSCIEVTVDMDPISVMNVLIKLFLLICIHFAQVRSSLYLGTPGKVTSVPFLILIKLYAFRCVVDDSVTCSLGGQCIRVIYSIKTL
jgi:hypothetical protein